MSNRVKTVLWIVFATLFLVAPASARPQKAGDLEIRPWEFTPRDGAKIQAERGRLLVPENRTNPKSNLIEIAFVRFKSTSSNPGPPIVYLAGGPGGSGVATARGARFPLFMAMREIGDVIALDQRGVGWSKPELSCPGAVNYPLDQPGDRDKMLQTSLRASRECADHWKRQGVDLSGYNTNENADDLEDLRKALGAPKISLWSISYGTHLAIAAIRRHEKSIHRVILAGVEGPEHTIKLPSQIQENLEKVSLLVKADPVLSKQIPDLLVLMKQVLDRLEKQPMVLETTDEETKKAVKVTIGKFDLQRITASVVGNTPIRDVPAVFDAFSKGRTSGVFASAIAQRAYGERTGGIGSAMSYMMDCASGVSKERMARIEREAKGTLLGYAIDFPHPDVCSAWGSPDLGPAFRTNIKTGVPALFISGTLDARTPISNAEEVRKGFRNSAHLIIEGAVHSDPLFLATPQVKEVMLQFMKGVPVTTTRIAGPPMKFTPLGE